jgi:hypothetical protein
LVDYSCPEQAGAWFERAFRQQIESGRASVVRVGGCTQFHKSAALNVGARHAIERGAQYLCFVDADTILRPGFDSWLFSHLAPSRFVIAGTRSNGFDVDCLMGVLALSTEAFTKSGGFDPMIEGWGAEDIELRLKLHLQLGLPYERIPLRFLSYIEHGDALRDENYALPKGVSHDRNFDRTLSKVATWTGRELHELGPTAWQLAGQAYWFRQRILTTQAGRSTDSSHGG